MYNDNPTLDNITQKLDPKLQGQVFDDENSDNSSQRKFYIESYGCAMNFSDSEIVASILAEEGYHSTKEWQDADLILINTCSIRDKAEQTVRHRLANFNNIKKKKPGTLIGVLGCMAERLKAKLLDQEKLVDIVLGPDAYRDLPNLIRRAEEGGFGSILG